MFVKIIAAVIFLAATSCQFKEVKGGANKSKVDAKTDRADFVTIKEKILRDRCLGCHQAPNLKGPDISTYENAMGFVVKGAPSRSEFYNTIASGHMPKGGAHLPAAEQAMIYNWILNGAPNVANSDASVPPTVIPPPELPSPPPEAKFSSIKTLIFEKKCFGCHGPKSEGRKLDTYENVMDGNDIEGFIVSAGDLKSNLLVRVQTGDMPREASKLSDEEINAIQTWIVNGAKND